MFDRLILRFDLMIARRNYKRADKACLNAFNHESVPGLYGALETVRLDLAEKLIQAETDYLHGSYYFDRDSVYN